MSNFKNYECLGCGAIITSTGTRLKSVVNWSCVFCGSTSYRVVMPQAKSEHEVA